MIHVEDTLRPEHVLLGLVARTPEEATAALLEALREDERVLDWEEFRDALRKHPPCRVTDSAPYGICIPHARTAAVNAMVMAAARLATDTLFPDCTQPVRYVFCLGVPQEMAADYLRIAGLIMRIFSDPATDAALSGAETGEAFVEVLEGLEVKI